MIAETEIAAPVVRWLSELGWDVFQEVRAGGQGNQIADVVARLETERGNRLIWVVEAKRSLSLALLAQAEVWTRHAHFVSIAVPEQKSRGPGRGRPRRPWLVRRILELCGIGMMTVNLDPETDRWMDPDEPERVRVRRAPNLHRLPPAWARDWDGWICPEHRDGKLAGSPGGGTWSPFRQTCRGVERFVQEHPGCTMKEAVEGVDHHYANDASARVSLRKWIQMGKVPGLKLRIVAGKARLWPSTAP